MEPIFLNFGNFATCLKIFIFSFWVLIISSSSLGISIEVQDGLGSETTNVHQNIYSNPNYHYDIPNQQKLKDEQPNLVPTLTTLSPINYKYTLAFIGKSTKSAHDKSEFNIQDISLPKVVPTASGKYVQLTNTVSHSVQKEPQPYKYGYRVTDPHKGAEFGHSETHDGNTVKGYYHVLLPDGRLQTVEYWAGSSGYHAFITYDGKNY